MKKLICMNSWVIFGYFSDRQVPDMVHSQTYKLCLYSEEATSD